MHTLNHAVYSKALAAAKAGRVTHDAGDPGYGADSCIGTEDGKPGYPILSGGRVSAKHVGLALGYAKKNGEKALIGALQRISDAIHAHEATNMSQATDTNGIELSRKPRIASCPRCKSYDLDRKGSTHHGGPTDSCRRCGHVFPIYPGTVTVAQANEGAGPDTDDDAKPPAMLSRYGREAVEELRLSRYDGPVHFVTIPGAPGGKGDLRHGVSHGEYHRIRAGQVHVKMKEHGAVGGRVVTTKGTHDVKVEGRKVHVQRHGGAVETTTHAGPEQAREAAASRLARLETEAKDRKTHLRTQLMATKK